MNALSSLRGIILACFFVLHAGQAAPMDTVFQGEDPGTGRIVLPDYFKYHKIQDIAFDDKGILYLSSDHRISVFNGTSWNYVSTHGKTFLTATLDHRICYADGEGFGTVTTDSSLEYKTLRVATLPASAGISQLRSHGDFIFINAGEKIFVLTNDPGTGFKPLPMGSRLEGNGQNLLILTSDGSGTPAGAPDSLIFHPGLPEKVIYRSIPGGYLAFMTREHRFISLSSGMDSPATWGTDLSGDVTDFICDGHGHVYILDSDLSVYLTDLNGRVLARINGLPFRKNSETKLVRSPYGQVWLVQDHSIHTFDYPAAVTDVPVDRFSNDLDDFAIFNDTLFLATGHGLFTSSGRLLLTPDPVVRLITAKDDLLACTDNMIYRTGNHKPATIPFTPGGDIQADPVSGNLVSAADSGFWVLTHESGFSSSRFFKTPAAPGLFLPDNDRVYSVSGNTLSILDTSTGMARQFQDPFTHRTGSRVGVPVEEEAAPSGREYDPGLQCAA